MSNISRRENIFRSDSGGDGTPSESLPKATQPSGYRGYYRSARRQAHHEDAHAELPAAEDSQRGRGDPLTCLGPPLLIETQPELLALLDRLRSAGSFAYDSEFIGEATYTPKLCLVQIATTAEVGLVDPLAPGIDLTPFWKLLCDGSIEKIVHAGQQDVEPVIRITGDRPRNLFDTQIAAGFVGLTYPVALSKLVAELAGAKLAKSMTFTQWDARPLSATQLRYAADDVRYLPAIRADIVARLDERGQRSWAEEEFEALCEPTQYIFNPDTYIHRVRGSSSLSATQLRILRELVIWRDGAARRADAPARAYLKDEVLIDLSRSPAKSVDKLRAVRGLPRPVEAEFGQKIVEATLRGIAAPPAPGLMEDKAEEMRPTAKFKADAIWTAAQALCHGRGIDPMMGTSRAEIGRLASAVLAGKTPPADLRLLRGWREQVLGEPLIRLLRDGGEVSVRV